MDDGLAPVAHLIMFFDYRRPVARRALLYDRPVVMFACGDPGTYRADMDANVTRQNGSSYHARNGCRKEVLLHCLLQGWCRDECRSGLVRSAAEERNSPRTVHRTVLKPTGSPNRDGGRAVGPHG